MDVRRRLTKLPEQNLGWEVADLFDSSLRILSVVELRRVNLLCEQDPNSSLIDVRKDSVVAPARASSPSRYAFGRS